MHTSLFVSNARKHLSQNFHLLLSLVLANSLCLKMLTFLTSYFNSIPLDTTKSLRGSKGTNLIYRDELSKKILPKKIKKGDNSLASYKEEEEKKNFEKRSYASSVEEKDVIRVKVRMTKQEAARLMSKCKEGGVLEFKDVAHEIAQLPVNRVTVMSSNGGYGGVLHSIPEEK